MSAYRPNFIVKTNQAASGSSGGGDGGSGATVYYEPMYIQGEPVFSSEDLDIMMGQGEDNAS